MSGCVRAFGALGVHAAAVQVLLNGGADVGARSNTGMTALLFAARGGDIETVRTLASGGANINEAATDAIPRRQTTEAVEALPPRLGSSILATAIENAHYDLAAWLVAEGADPNVDGPRGTALPGPYFRAHDETAALLRELMGPNAPPRPTTQGCALTRPATASSGPCAGCGS